MASEEELKAEIARLRAENEALQRPARGQMSLKVSEKGALSVYGLGRFPVTLYREQWALSEFIDHYTSSATTRAKEIPCCSLGLTIHKRQPNQKFSAGSVSEAS